VDFLGTSAKRSLPGDRLLKELSFHHHYSRAPNKDFDFIFGSYCSGVDNRRPIDYVALFDTQGEIIVGISIVAAEIGSESAIAYTASRIFQPFARTQIAGMNLARFVECFEAKELRFPDSILSA
jgi:hypothetical protein